jgi:dipeptidyl aminopeptidase/acylaminoacyl peptidase
MMGSHVKFRFLIAVVLAALATPALAQKTDADKFGARESVIDISLSPDGQHIAFVEPGPGRSSFVSVATLGATAAAKRISASDGNPWRYVWCNWASNTRLVCKLYSIMSDSGQLLPVTRLIAINADGTELKSLGQRQNARTIGFSQFDGDIIGWPRNDNGDVLMSRSYLPEATTGTNLASTAEGLGVDRINSSTLKSARDVRAYPRAVNFIADDRGEVRIMQSAGVRANGVLTGKDSYSYRKPGESVFKSFSTPANAALDLTPVAVDATSNTAYAFGRKDGRAALYKVKLDDSLEATLVLANDKVDIATILTFGRAGRVFGADIVTDKRETVIFDPAYQKLATQLGKAIPGLPLIRFVAASRDENIILLFAGSDVDPGRYFVFDKAKKALNEITLARPQLEGAVLSPVKIVSYKANDGTIIPAYLTLPAKGPTKGLPAIVMPHGGPSSRDEWGFDWLAQYFAAQGFAVLQPNFRGSSGYGDTWYVDNGFKSWRVAIGDVNDAGHWLIDQGIADKAKLGILGWSYGGYAALQTSVVEPDLFKAIVAIAPVTDLRMLIDQSRNYTNAEIVADFVGSGEHIVSGSPLKHVDAIKSPVLLFSGDIDLNVNVSHARAMNDALKRVGKPTELIVYKGLDHYLEDTDARADMLSKSLIFFKARLGAK